jgi:SulP family sulfate permease
VPYRFTLLSVFLLTVVFDLTVAVQLGIVAACVTFIVRIARLSRADALAPPELKAAGTQVQVKRLSGAVLRLGPAGRGFAGPAARAGWCSTSST